MKELNVKNSSNVHDATKWKGCKHYQRKARLVAPCCDKVYVCRLCHDENEDHQMKRHMVEEVVCASCDHRQPVSNSCAQCKTVFGKYYCSECRLYDDTEKQQYHCNDCGICRCGGRDNYFHCDRCDLCVPKSLENSHKCLEKGGHMDCGVCLEDIHSSRSGSRSLPCGHMLHTPCQEDLLAHGISTCPKCNASVCNMDLIWRRMDKQIKRCAMPPELRHCFVDVLCRDCHRRGETLFHHIGLKCTDCGSYNTVREPGPVTRRPRTSGFFGILDHVQNLIGAL
ncbi:RING finger and CHY zinc finger domain-containing protein 1-like [Pollicipes pollicipes]|uniref:RING finger and CHY zinc finger domain-containing protein 1-like n=1 Tax=Pollicipes pollicipes TaxID=41117 RepID=UPI0018854A06|nr:RING finger and CHY zinc finger domain-containing protein 1-like [Pollicipes pollicipes]